MAFYPKAPWAASSVCPCSLYDRLIDLAEASRPVLKAKKVKIKEGNLHSFSQDVPSIQIGSIM